MAIEERRPKKERRAEARAERKRQEEAARKERQKRQFTGVLGAVVILAFIGAGLYFAFDSAGGGEEITVSAAAAEEARNAAGCEVLVEHEPFGEPTHYDPAEAPPADVLYAGSEVRPAHSGPHFGPSALQPIGGIPSSPLEERGIVHNLEHGSVVVWFDGEAVEGGTQGQMENWMNARQGLGFEGAGGGNVFVSPYDSISSGKPIAFRAWGVAMDCDTWDQTVADSFLIDYWGTHGRAPERNLSPYPDEALGYSDATVEDDTVAPTSDRHETATPAGDPTDGASPAETGAPSPADDTSPTESAS